MRALVLALAALTLCACNQVYSRAPLVSEQRQSEDPEFHSGLWQVTGYENRCQFDIRKRRRDWPDCAVGVEFKRGQMFLVTGTQRVLAQTQRLTGADPILLQGHWQAEMLKDPRVPEPKTTDNPYYGWTYAAVTPVRFDAAGRMMEAKLVIAECGPLPYGGSVTNRPLPGLAIVGQNCVAKDLDTVRAALKSAMETGPVHTLRLIREEP